MYKTFFVITALAVAQSIFASETADNNSDRLSPTFGIICTDPSHKNFNFKQVASKVLATVTTRLARERKDQIRQLNNALNAEKAEHLKTQTKWISEHETNISLPDQLEKLKTESLENLKLIAELEERKKNDAALILIQQGQIKSLQASLLKDKQKFSSGC